MATVIRGASQKPYRVVLPESGSWSLHDLYVFPHAYEQCYAFIYCLDTELPARDIEAIDYAVLNYPWKGGYSYVNFYALLQRQVPVKDRPKIKSIHKASPGWIDLILNLDAAKQVALAVATLSGATAAAAAAYAKAYKILLSLKPERARARSQQFQLTQAHIKSMRGTCDELAKAMGFKSLAELNHKTGNIEVSMKLLAAQYRRLKTLVEFEQKNKAVLPFDGDT